MALSARSRDPHVFPVEHGSQAGPRDPAVRGRRAHRGRALPRRAAAAAPSLVLRPAPALRRAASPHPRGPVPAWQSLSIRPRPPRRCSSAVTRLNPHRAFPRTARRGGVCALPQKAPMTESARRYISAPRIARTSTETLWSNCWTGIAATGCDREPLHRYSRLRRRRFGMGCAKRGEANGQPFASLATKQTARNAPSLRAAAQCGVCGAALLGIVGRLRPSSRVLHPSASRKQRNREYLCRGSLVRRPLGPRSGRTTAGHRSCSRRSPSGLPATPPSRRRPGPGPFHARMLVRDSPASRHTG